MRRGIWILAISGAALTVSSAVLAFPFMRSWHDPADGNDIAAGIRGGGGGIYGTGSAQDFGILCSHCHIGGAGKISATIAATPAFMTLAGEKSYKPGGVYKITVGMVGEHRGLGQADDNTNGVVVAIETAAGKTAGSYKSDSGADSAACPPNAPAKSDPTLKTTYVYGDCHGVLFTEAPNQTSWTFDWTAPAAGTGEVTLFYGMVDGDHHAASSLDDDVKQGTLKIVEGL